jgi:hypothetical protein
MNPVQVECEKLYKIISNASKKLDNIRTQCEHPALFRGYYNDRAGRYSYGYICSDCNKFIEEIQDSFQG